jgi:hypothetical protein
VALGYTGKKRKEMGRCWAI